MRDTTIIMAKALPLLEETFTVGPPSPSKPFMTSFSTTGLTVCLFSFPMD